MKARQQDPLKTALDLTVFSAVVSLMEGGHLYDGKSHNAAAKVIAICQREQRRLLRQLDAAEASIKGGRS